MLRLSDEHLGAAVCSSPSACTLGLLDDFVAFLLQADKASLPLAGAQSSYADLAKRYALPRPQSHARSSSDCNDYQTQI
ncbi:MAG: hypothetical protein MUC43_16960, partial [Pirellula sp.]|nr:hypothetical protein [Pirellula sp.]